MIYQIKNIHSSITPCERGQDEKPKLVSNSTVTIVELAKVIQGTFHQGKTELFGETAGSKCFWMVLVIITYAVIKGASRWNQTDLDIIFLNGDAVDKMLGKQTFLTIKELPRNVELAENSFMADFKGSNLFFFIRRLELSTKLFRKT